MTARHARAGGSQPAREEAIRGVVDDAHLNLATDTLAEFLLAARRTIAPESTSARSRRARRPRRDDGSPATRPYLKPIETLVNGQERHVPPLSSPRRLALLTYIEDVAARPRGAGLVDMEAA